MRRVLRHNYFIIVRLHACNINAEVKNGVWVYFSVSSFSYKFHLVPTAR